MEAMIDRTFLVDARRNAYIECTENYLSSNTIVGVFGDEMPLEVFYACGTVPVPMEGVDSHIFKFGKEGEWEDVCDVIKSTLIYLTTQKCPILYSCKMYVMQNTCQKFIEAIKANTEKLVLVYDDEETLIAELCKVYGTSYNEIIRQEARADLDYINGILQKTKRTSLLTCEDFFLLEFYSKYMINLKMRREYFEELEKKLASTNVKMQECEMEEVRAFCPRGNYSRICQDLDTFSLNSGTPKTANVPIPRIKRVWDKAIYGYANCPFACEKQMGY